jgi:hypothetical protein
MDETKEDEEKEEEEKVDYFFSKLDYFGSNEHTFETETKLDLHQTVLVKLWKAKQDHEEALAKIEGVNYVRDPVIDIDGILKDIQKTESNVLSKENLES